MRAARGVLLSSPLAAAKSLAAERSGGVDLFQELSEDGLQGGVLVCADDRGVPLFETPDDDQRVLEQRASPAGLNHDHRPRVSVRSAPADIAGTLQCGDLLTGRLARHAGAPRQRGHRAPVGICLLYTSPSPRDGLLSRM